MDALARLPFGLAFAMGAILAQKLAFRPASFFVLGLGAGAFRLLPVSRLYLALPFAVKPAPLLTGSFSPRPIDKLGFFWGIRTGSFFVNDQGHLARRLVLGRNADMRPAIKLPDHLIKR